MKKALKTTLRGLSKPEFARLRDLCHTAKNLYNQAVYLIRQEYESTGNYLNYYEMDRRMKTVTNLEGTVNYRLLKAGVSQQILRRLDANYRAFFKALAAWKADPSAFSGRPQPPFYRREPLANLIYDAQRFRVKDGRIVLEKGLSLRLPDMLRGKNIVQVEVMPRAKRFYAVMVYEDGQTPAAPRESDVTMGIDLGLDNLAACVTTTGQAVIVNGRPIKSVNQFYNKTKARLQAQLETRQHVKHSARLSRLTEKRNRRVNDYLHKASRLIVNACVKHNVSRVVIGNVVLAQNGANLGARNNQHFVNLPLGQLVDQLRYKLELHGVTVQMTDESYTSKASFMDNDALPERHADGNHVIFSGKRVKRGLYRTAAGRLMNADLNGAYNIIRKVVRGFNFTELQKRIAGRFSPHCRVVTCL